MSLLPSAETIRTSDHAWRILLLAPPAGRTRPLPTPEGFFGNGAGIVSHVEIFAGAYVKRKLTVIALDLATRQRFVLMNPFAPHPVPT